MVARYVTIGRNRFRVEFNWNAIMAFLVESGHDTMEGLSALRNLKPSEITALAVAGIAEGERIDGREFALTKEDLGREMTPDTALEIIEIYVAQNNNPTHKEPEQDSSAVTPAKKKSLFRRSAKSKE